MLGEDYPRLLASLIEATTAKIELPEGYERFFEEQGPMSAFADERRSSVRMRVRTRGILIVEKSLPAFDRKIVPELIYTKDFSKSGFAFLAHQQFYPGEVVRIILATLWLRVAIKRCRRLGPSCFDSGAILVSQHEPSIDAFAGIAPTRAGSA